MSALVAAAVRGMRVSQVAASGGASPFLDEDFTSGDFSGTDDIGEFSWIQYIGNPIVVSDIPSGAPSTHAVEFDFGPDADGEDTNCELRFDFGTRQLAEWWWEFYVYFPIGTETQTTAKYYHRQQSSPTNNKFFFFWRDNYSTASTDATYPKIGQELQITGAGSGGDGTSGTEGEGNSQMRAMSQINGNTFISGTGLGDPMVTDSDTDTINRGQWVRMRYQFVLGTPGNSDGIYRVWIGDTFFGEWTGEFAGTDSELNYINNGSLIGYANSGFTDLTLIWVTAVKFWDADPEWGLSTTNPIHSHAS